MVGEGVRGLVFYCVFYRFGLLFVRPARDIVVVFEKSTVDQKQSHRMSCHGRSADEKAKGGWWHEFGDGLPSDGDVAGQTHRIGSVVVALEGQLGK